ncbi:DUF3857 domain-containing protein [Mucilaginibacter sp. HMF5004]|uniref:DUF3857 domain-containing protein n=1 Tax=Mucilaginibacter rivuli TaxID=2857527 RepID=UPI001C602175|nr:DUF3857 domain-containing protein [Mucilaginibacter rivuli]MBW4890759.1 DUF3857 domain-containing protein [Mucilaginibacter rivuli]
MMKKHILLAVLALSAVKYAQGQTTGIETEKWADKPVIHQLSGAYAKESAVIVSDSRRTEYVDDKKEVLEYYTLHKLIHINDDRGIEEFNKIYLGIGESSDVIAVKARTILPGGKIIELDKNNIKDLKEDNGNIYKIFAMDGLEKGCEVEYFYTFKKSTSYFGRELIQGSVPIMASSFKLIAPERLRFEVKPFNSTVTSIDTLLNSKHIITCNFKDIAGAENEKYAFYDANLIRLEFKLSYNDEARRGERLFTWNELAKRVFNIYSFYTDKEYKQASEIVAQNGWDKLADETQKIIAVESYVKKRYTYKEEMDSEDANKLESVIRNKIGGLIGTMRLYSAIFQNLGINRQIVLAGDRNKFIIDRSFENWNNCDNPLFYFPAEKKFIAPSRPDYRFPWIYPSWGEANGLFCKITTLGTVSSALAEIKPIVLEDYTKSTNNLESKIELNAGLDSLTIDSKQIYGGYAAVDYRDVFNFANDEQRKDVIKQLAKSVSSTDHILSSEIKNQDFENGTTNQPLIIQIKTKSGELLERAGNKLLVKIGLAIGPQVEMYQEKPRQQTVGIEYGHIEERKIDFTIPDGYAISNLNDLKMNQVFLDNGELTMGFVSGYEIKGNVLSIHIMEEYRKTFYPLNQFEQFRKIINASSDFNKVVLVLEKKS